jgi:hypothetical protein
VLLIVILATPAPGRAAEGPPVDPIPTAHEERPNQSQIKPTWPRRVTPPLPREFLTVSGFTSVQVNVDADGNNIVGDAANEPSIAVDPLAPSRIAIGWRQFDTIQSDFRQAGWAYSQDGGASWTFPGVLEPDVFRSDPVLGFDHLGTFYYYSLRNDFCCDMFVSEDRGVTWPQWSFAFGGDKEWFTIDRTAGIGQGNIYASWNRIFDCRRGGNDFTRSTDGGFTFSQPVPLPEHVFWGTLTVAPDGALYISSATMDVTKSVDAQDPESEPTFHIAGIARLGGDVVSRTGPNPGGLLGQVWIDADHSGGSRRGDIYALSSVRPAAVASLDVMIGRSRDGGATWDDPVRVNDDPPPSLAWQWFGTMSVAPSGRIDAAWNDTRNTGQVNLSELFYAFSIDGGQTWTKNMAISPVFDSFLGWPGNPPQRKIGDYYHMISDDGGAHLAYAATFNGEQDVYYVYIAPDCNHNGIHDGDDIMLGTSEDANGNFIPDECEGCVRDPQWVCDGDVDGNGAVNPVDIGLIQASFCPGGGCPNDALCQYDLDCNGAINPVDVGIVQSLFGTCQAPRDVCP